MNKIRIYFALLLLSVFASCSDFEKLKKHGTTDEKYAKAMEFYSKGDFNKAQQLFEDLASSVSFGSEQGQTILYYQAMTNYQLEDYILAGYQFNNFARRYPLAERAEECAYMSAYCHYLNSPPHTLDQTDTRDAITQFTYFVKQYPKSSRVPECNKLIDKLYEKLELKSYEIARQYYRIEDYKAAIAAFQNLLREFPDSKHREEANYIMLRSNYLLAQHSIPTKAEERIAATISGCQKFKAEFKDSKYENDVNSLAKDAQRFKDHLDREKKANQ